MTGIIGGGVVGSFFGPVGAVIGAALGALAGANVHKATVSKFTADDAKFAERLS